jgi:hypothetical protein
MDSVNVLVEARAALRAASFPLRLPGAAAARESAAALLAQIDDYLVPRLRRLDGPLLAVVGGSTGAGKSTLVNSLVRAPICPAGALRPTTRAPLLVGHPVDTAWFRERTLLPRLARSGPGGGADGGAERTLHIVNSPQLAPGLALIDAPDIDSVVAANRALARELLAAADLWLFLTTAARYADAVPWRALREARRRGTMVAIVLDRVPPHARDEVSIHFARMLGSQGLGETGLFVVAESTPDQHGLLPDVDIAPIRRWLHTVAGSPAHRDRVLRRTLIGALVAAGSTVETLADAADDQAGGAAALAATAQAAFDGARDDVDAALRSGAMLRGEVYARWRDLVAGGELRRAVRARSGRLEVRVGERPPSGRRLLPALARAIAALVSEADLAAARRCGEAWRADPAGRALLAADPTLGRPWPGFTDAAHDLVHDWSTRLRVAVRRQGGPRTRTRSLESAATLLLVTIAAVAPPVADVTAEGVGPDLLRAILEDEHVHGLAEQARADLLARVEGLYAAEVQRHLAALTWVDADLGPRLRAVAARLRDAGRHLAARGEDAA